MGRESICKELICTPSASAWRGQHATASDMSGSVVNRRRGRERVGQQHKHERMGEGYTRGGGVSLRCMCRKRPRLHVLRPALRAHASTQPLRVSAPPAGHSLTAAEPRPPPAVQLPSAPELPPTQLQKQPGQHASSIHGESDTRHTLSPADSCVRWVLMPL